MIVLNECVYIITYKVVLYSDSREWHQTTHELVLSALPQRYYGKTKNSNKNQAKESHKIIYDEFTNYTIILAKLTISKSRG